MVNPRPAISVITPSFNQGPIIRETFESVFPQGGDDWEHIVVDGGSSDETLSILREYKHLRWVSEADRGQADALNKGMVMSLGELIFWTNSDDLVAPGAFDAARPTLLVSERVAPAGSLPVGFVMAAVRSKQAVSPVSGPRDFQVKSSMLPNIGPRPFS